MIKRKFYVFTGVAKYVRVSKANLAAVSSVFRAAAPSVCNV